MRLRNEIRFNVFAHKTNLEIPESGAGKQTLTNQDFQVFPYGERVVSEVREAEAIEDITGFVKQCLASNSAELRGLYASKPYLDRLNRSSLEGLGYYGAVGVEQTTVLPKLFVKRQPKGHSVLDKELDGKASSKRDARKMRAIEEIHDRYSLLTREHKIWQRRKLGKSVVGNFQNDIVHLGFASQSGSTPGGVPAVRQFVMPAEVTDIGVENITLKPLTFEDERSRELDHREYVRQEDGLQVELLEFSVGGALLQGGESQDNQHAFLAYLLGEEFDSKPVASQIEELQKTAIQLNFYPVLNFNRPQIVDYTPRLPYCISVLARVCRVLTSEGKAGEEPTIASMGLEFIYKPLQDSYSRDINEYDQWERVSSYTEVTHFIAVHTSIQLLFGFDRAQDEAMREEGRSAMKESEESEESEEEENEKEGAEADV
tara:strand:- start:630 stop:1919 length:1290 start_codon:yes stop_codon:yes gene_type:complete